jgi:hypothetical protein
MTDKIFDDKIDHSENTNKFLEPEIDPLKLWSDWKEVTNKNTDWNENVVTGCFHIQSNVFTTFIHLARVIHEGTAWNKKARIVLEYDPQQEALSIVTIMPYGDVLVKQQEEKWYREYFER